MSGNKVDGIAFERSTGRYIENLKWGASNMNTLLEVDLGTKTILLRRPSCNSMYSKKQSLHIIKSTTMKSSKERGHLIQFLDNNMLVPSQRSLYKLLERDEKGLSINNDDWGNNVTTQQLSRVTDMVFWDSDPSDNVITLPPPSKKRELIRDKTIAHDIFVRWSLLDEKGWKGCIRLCVHPIKFCELQSIETHLWQTPSLFSHREQGHISLPK